MERINVKFENEIDFSLTHKEALKYWENGAAMFFKDVDKDKNTILIQGTDNPNLTLDEAVECFKEAYNIKNVRFLAFSKPKE